MPAWYRFEDGVITPYNPAQESLQAMQSANSFWRSESAEARIVKIAAIALIVFVVLACVIGSPPPLIAFVGFTFGFFQGFNDQRIAGLSSSFTRGILDGAVAGAVYAGCSLLTAQFIPPNALPLI